MREYERISATIMRGGTSKGIYILENELPKDPVVRDNVILSIYGSPDTRQIDGLGGANPLTSKFAMVRISDREDADIDYTFGQVSITDHFIDYSVNCGNIISGVGPFAINNGLVKVEEPITKVRIYNTNTKKIIQAEVPVLNGKAKTDGDFQINGVPGTGAKILLNFLNADGARTGKLLPTGNVKDTLTLSTGKTFEVSIIDVANLCVFVRASDIGLIGTELPHELPNHAANLIEEIRSVAAYKLGFVNSVSEASTLSPASPKIMFVGEKNDYFTINGSKITKSDVNFLSRAIAMEVMHQAYPVTGGICTAVASLLKGTIVNEIYRNSSENSFNEGNISKDVKIGHPSGAIELAIEIEYLNGQPILKRAAVPRTARTIMEGFVFVPSDIYWAKQETESQEKNYSFSKTV
ncbi:2-methylaconitate cis-trans isomerase PrpF family protein [Anaerobacillus sp. MEB173]|uniref:2-methylaconitate cis-trans isomerase PrpF family protein n=1 Tax=Anaerobacillus sp. MEB173 TaxID=3383345 RepID=UPI003F8E54B1